MIERDTISTLVHAVSTGDTSFIYESTKKLYSLLPYCDKATTLWFAATIIHYTESHHKEEINDAWRIIHDKLNALRHKYHV